MSRTPVELVEHVAERLEPLGDRLVFLGGAVTGFLVTDPAAPSPRATEDVDVIVEVGSTVAYQAELAPALERLGAKVDTRQGAPLCRWILDGVVVDVMPTDPRVLGFSNRWYPSAIRTALPFTLPSGRAIALIDAPHFIATKTVAFEDRGEGDYAASKDMEDIIAVVDGREALAGEVTQADADVRDFVKSTFANWLAERRFLHALPGHLPGNMEPEERAEVVLERIRVIVGRKA